MAFQIKRRGILTSHYRAERAVFSSVEMGALPAGSLCAHRTGSIGSESAARNLQLIVMVTMHHDREIPRLFRPVEAWPNKAEALNSVATLGSAEVHLCGGLLKSILLEADPAGFPVGLDSLRKGYDRTYAACFRDRAPDEGLFERLAVPASAASYVFSATALHQRASKERPI